MRICLASIHPRLLSGQIDALAGLARALRARGHDVRVVSVFAEGDVDDPQRALGSAAEPGSLPTRLFRLGRIWADLVRASREADVVQVNLPTPGFALFGDLLAAGVRPPLVVGFEAHLARPADILIGRRWRRAPAFYLPRLAINNQLTARLARYGAARYVVASELQRSELVELGVGVRRVERIPNLFDWSRLIGDVDDSIDAIPDDGPIVGYVGHFNHIKGVDVLVRAFPRLRAALPAARLVIAWSGLGSPGPVRQAIDAIPPGDRDRLHLLGRVSVAALLKRCGAFVLPYRLTLGQSAFPGLVLEAMATGVPLVTSDLPLLRELDGGQGIALLAQPDDSDDLALKIHRLLGDPDLSRRMVARQRVAVAERFDPDRLAERYERLYEDVIDKRRRAALAAKWRQA